jgi:hypothetical protein
MAEKYNTLVIRLKISQLKKYDETTFLHIHDFEGKGHPDFITLVLEADDVALLRAT